MGKPIIEILTVVALTFSFCKLDCIHYDLALICVLLLELRNGKGSDNNNCDDIH